MSGTTCGYVRVSAQEQNRGPPTCRYAGIWGIGAKDHRGKTLRKGLQPSPLPAVGSAAGYEHICKKGNDFTRDPELWIAFFARYPLLFNFRERESKIFDKKDFSLDANAELINDCLGANTPKNIADAFIKALQKASGKVIATSSENEHLQYLTLIRSYDKASTLTIYRAELKLEVIGSQCCV